uniref:Col_cuticle_N domain-containing protein n=1 Tax=Steinernema glaseri TaxID=37863 RepID=A0A1I7YC15_9BILA
MLHMIERFTHAVLFIACADSLDDTRPAEEPEVERREQENGDAVHGHHKRKEEGAVVGDRIEQGRREDSSAMDLEGRIKAYRFVAYSAVTFSVVAVLSVCVTLPMVYNYVHHVRRQMHNEISFCKGSAKDIWSE